MGQAKEKCEICTRPPGSRHSDNCPRSRRMHRLMSNTLAHLSRPRPVWLNGTITFQKRDTKTGKPTGSLIEATNPGLPYVRPPSIRRLNRNRMRARGVSGDWKCGGIPRDQYDACREFAKQLGVI